MRNRREILRIPGRVQLGCPDEARRPAELSPSFPLVFPGPCEEPPRPRSQEWSTGQKAGGRQRLRVWLPVRDESQSRGCGLEQKWRPKNQPPARPRRDLSRGTSTQRRRRPPERRGAPPETSVRAENLTEHWKKAARLHAPSGRHCRLQLRVRQGLRESPPESGVRRTVSRRLCRLRCCGRTYGRDGPWNFREELV